MYAEPPVDELRKLFDSINYEHIQEFVTENRQEGIHLEFKTIPRSPHLERDARRNFARALSGFANSDGGIIVWGIDCRKDEEGVDAAQSCEPINGLMNVLSRFLSWTSQATSPLIDGVLHEAISQPND